MESRPNHPQQYLPCLKALFGKIHRFNTLPESTLEHIAKITWPHHFDPGKVIYFDGQLVEYIYLLEHGWVKATRTSREGRGQAMMFLQTGEIFGDIALYSGSEEPVTIEKVIAVLNKEANP